MPVRIPDTLDALLVPIDAVRPDPANVMRHPPSHIDALAASLVAFGFDQPILARRNGLIIAGHGRLLAARQVGMTHVPVVYTDLDGIDAARRMIGDNRLAALAEPDTGALAELLRQLQAEDALGGTGYDDAAVDALLKEVAGATPPADDPGPQLDKAAELQSKWGTALGQVWALGEHRLACGDCTDPAVVANVMQGERADMVFTDPPYGVAVGDKNKFLNSIAPSNRVEENLLNDTLDEPALAALLAASFDNAVAVCTAGAAWYVAAPAGPLHLLFGQALKERGIWRQIIHWVKNNATFAPLGVDYHWQEEPIFYGWVPGAAHRYYGGRQQTTVWEIDRPQKSPEHPTMKPVELVERAVTNSSQPGEMVLDMFVGSGTTLIACERLGRKCRAVELSPGYVAVTLQRWADMTGQTPRLVES